MAGDDPQDQRDAEASPSDVAASIDVTDYLEMVVEAVRDVAAVQSSHAAAMTMWIDALDEVVTAHTALHDSLTELQACIAPRAGGGTESLNAGQRSQIVEQAITSRAALRKQAHQAHQQADKLRSRAESLVDRASELVRESRRIAEAGEQSHAHAGRHPVADRHGSTE